ncbi:MAG: HesA/MoeB/ThiF family protein [Magnetococcales bacterium]|nr:HesA/MoeB/ThiF family protein [Magnetococcales bacterium]
MPSSLTSSFTFSQEAAARLRDARVFILGAGGLGSPVALFLAQAGIGHLVIADGDRVELSNLHRQILHQTRRIGAFKTDSARSSLLEAHPITRVTAFPERVTETSLARLAMGCDLLVDGSDNFASRYLLNRYCMEQRLPFVSGAVLGFEGQVATFRHGVDDQAPCYQCLHPRLEEGCMLEEGLPTCATAGVLGAVAGVIGALQAGEVVKAILGLTGEQGRLFLVNPLDQVYLKIVVPKDPACPVCGVHEPAALPPNL